MVPLAANQLPGNSIGLGFYYCCRGKAIQIYKLERNQKPSYEAAFGQHSFNDFYKRLDKIGYWFTFPMAIFATHY